MDDDPDPGFAKTGDGTIGERGCIFCSRGGSGDFASDASLSITEQIEKGLNKKCFYS